jgi:hypothetical protein
VFGFGLIGAAVAVAPAARAQTASLTFDPSHCRRRQWSGEGLTTRVINFAGAQPAPGLGAASLVIPVRLPVGAALKEVTVPYINPAATPMVLDVFRFAAGGTYIQFVTFATTPEQLLHTRSTTT